MFVGHDSEGFVIIRGSGLEAKMSPADARKLGEALVRQAQDAEFLAWCRTPDEPTGGDDG